MAKISTYATDGQLSLDDKLIGTDAENYNATKNYTFGAIISFFAANGLIPYEGATSDVDLGEYSLSLSDLILSNGLSANGSFGSDGDVLTSQGVGAPAVWKSHVFGSFYDTTDQSVASGSIAAFKYNTTVGGNGVSISNNLSGAPTRITFDDAGTYNIQFSAQLQRLSGGSSKQVTIWLRVDGVDIPHSATAITVQANATYLLASWNFFQEVTAGQFAEIMWSQNDTIDIVAEPANLVVPYPAIPSIILTVNKVS